MSTTTNLNLTKPDIGSTGWGSDINDNWDTLDGAVIQDAGGNVSLTGDLTLNETDILSIASLRFGPDQDKSMRLNWRDSSSAKVLDIDYKTGGSWDTVLTLAGSGFVVIDGGLQTRNGDGYYWGSYSVANSWRLRRDSSTYALLLEYWGGASYGEQLQIGTDGTLDLSGDLIVNGDASLSGRVAFGTADTGLLWGSYEGTYSWRLFRDSSAHTLRCQRWNGASYEDAFVVNTSSHLSLEDNNIGNVNILTAARYVCTPASATNYGVSTAVDGDSHPRWVARANGNFLWDDGSGTKQDVTLYRNGADELKTDDTFIVGTDLLVSGNVGVGTSDPKATFHGTGSTILGVDTGAVSDGDMGAGQVNVYVDETNDYLVFKIKYSDGSTVKSGTVSLS